MRLKFNKYTRDFWIIGIIGILVQVIILITSFILGTVFYTRLIPIFFIIYLAYKTIYYVNKYSNKEDDE